MKQESQGPRWYVVHTYSGYENKVKANIEKMVENREMQHEIFEVTVPSEKQEEEKDGKRKVKEKKIFPGYVIIKMIMTDDSWYLVRNTRGVTGFVGPGSKPVPLSDEEVKALGVMEPLSDIDFEVGERVELHDEYFGGHIGVIDSINIEKKKVKVYVSIFGRDTLVELDFNQIEKV